MYAKLFSRITESSIIEESITTRWVFVALLAISDSDGTVIGTDIAIARRINVPLIEFEASMKVLMAPDNHSNNQEFEGKRVVPSVGERGYFLTGYAKYRNLKTEDERRSYMKEYMAQRRSCKHSVNNVNFPLAQLTHTEAEANTDPNTEEVVALKGKNRKSVLSEEEFLASLKASPAYNHVNVPVELSKMDTWLLANPGRKKTRKFVVNWLNRIEAPISSNGTKTESIADSWIKLQKPKED